MDTNLTKTRQLYKRLERQLYCIKKKKKDNYTFKTLINSNFRILGGGGGWGSNLGVNTLALKKLLSLIHIYDKT